ncbi:hypothetical protein [Bradyrhizobium sp. DASA03007]
MADARHRRPSHDLNARQWKGLPESLLADLDIKLAERQRLFVLEAL